MYSRCIIRFTTGPDNTSAVITITKASGGVWAVYADDFALVEARYTASLDAEESVYAVVDAPS
jgi:hypothetical protein